MKKFLLILAVVAMLLPSCKKIEESINALENRIDKLEQSIPTIEEQISSIQTSIKALKEVDESLDESIKALEANDKATAEEIAALKDADKAIEAKIEELKKYVDDAINSTKDWVNATFATLEQLNALSSEVAALKSLVDANKAEAAANLATAIANLETSLKAWVGEQLSNYYTIAEIDAKIVNLEKAIADGDAALQQQLNDLKTQLESAKKELTEAYKKAIEEAITENNGVINTKIANEIAAVNKRIDEEVAAINAKIATMQAQVDKNTEDIAKLLARIQSVSYVPQYSDGKALVTRIGAVSEVILDFKVSPKECVAELEKVWSEALSCEAVYTKTRAVSLVKMPVTEFVADAENGVITVTASCENLSEEFFAGTQEASVALVISDGNNSVTSQYVPMVTKEITDEIWYTTTDNQPLTPNNDGVDIFGANIVSNSYNEESGWFVLKFDAPVTKIGEKAFGAGSENDPKSTLQSIILPNGVQSIDFHAFSYCCDELLSVYMPDTVSEIGRTAFADNDKLEYVRMSKNLTTMGVYAFSKCSSLKNINLPESLTAIPDYCFRHCSSLASITIPDSVTSIGESAFRECDALESIEIPSSVEVLSPQIFTRCNKLKDVILNEGLKTISYHCFMLCKSLDTIIIPNSVEIIESGVFDYAIVQKFAGKFTTEDGVCLIVDGVLKKVADSIPEYYTLPSTITTLGKGCFSSITPVKDTHITIPDSVTEFEVRAFGQTYNIAGFYGKYATEDHVAVIKDNILYGVAGRALPDKYFVPEGVVKIAEYAFDTVKYVSEIVLPSTIIEIETATLKVGETGRMLTALYCKASVPPVIGEKIFNDLVPEKYPTIYVPMQSRDAYLTADGWNKFADKIVGYDF